MNGRIRARIEIEEITYNKDGAEVVFGRSRDYDVGPDDERAYGKVLLPGVVGLKGLKPGAEAVLELAGLDADGHERRITEERDNEVSVL